MRPSEEDGQHRLRKVVEDLQVPVGFSEVVAYARRHRERGPRMSQMRFTLGSVKNNHGMQIPEK